MFSEFSKTISFSSLRIVLFVNAKMSIISKTFLRGMFILCSFVATFVAEISEISLNLSIGVLLAQTAEKDKLALEWFPSEFFFNEFLLTDDRVKM